MKASGVPFRFVPSIEAPVAEILRTVQVKLSSAKLILPALKISRRGALRFLPTATLDGYWSVFETRKRVFGSESAPDAIWLASIADPLDAGLVSTALDLILPEKTTSV